MAATAPPRARSGYFFGALAEFRKDPPGFLQRLAREHGDIVLVRLGRQTIYVISDPEMVRDVLVTRQSAFKKSRMLERARVMLGDGLLTAEGEHHKRQRRLMQPAFHRERLTGYSAAMVECAVRTRERWHAGQPFDVHKEMMHLTLAIVGRTLFSADIESDADEIGEALAEVFNLFEFIMLPFSEILEKLPLLPAVRRSREARDRLDRIVYRLIAERRASGQDTGDLLSMLLLAQDEEGSGGMSDEQIRDEALTLLLAGHETTANALTWSWYLLSQRPDAEAKFQAELAEVLGGRLPTMEDVPKLQYAEHVFAESLRLYPPAWAIGRRALEDFTVGPYTIPARAIVLMSPWVMHRDARWFPDPEAFRPERWEAEDSARPKLAYLPFGAGTRVCIGERFAWMEGVLLLATLGQKWRLRLVEGQQIATQARITLRPRYPIRMHPQG